MLRRCGAAAIVSAKCFSTGSPLSRGGAETRIAFASITAAVTSGFASLPSNTKASTGCLSAPDAIAAAFSRVRTVPAMRQKRPPYSVM